MKQRWKRLEVEFLEQKKAIVNDTGQMVMKVSCSSLAVRRKRYG